MNVLTRASGHARTRSDARPARPARWLAWLLLVLGVLGFAALWITLGAYSGRQNSWMAVLGALDIAWLLRLGGWPAGRGRALLGLLATGAIVWLVSWGITAAELGRDLGLQPWDSALKLGFDHAWTLAQLANHPGDLVWIALGLLLAVVVSR